jgi:methylated-DNA-[protein]-cysteine S-methyltransferase
LAWCSFFGTSIGLCGIAWTDRGICGVQLPESNDAVTRERLKRRFSGAAELEPPADIQSVIDDVVALLEGEPRDLSAAVLDEREVPDFNLRVYAVARSIAPGATLSYGEIAQRLGDAGLARAVGQALGQNPYPIIVPCHRVLAADGRAGGFSARGGVDTKLRLLEIERSRIPFELT